MNTHNRNEGLYIAVDASTEYLQIATMQGNILHEHSDHCGRKHSEVLMPTLHSLLNSQNRTDIVGLIAASGPGSFNGLRIAMSALKGLSAGLSIHMVSVSVLDAIALGYKLSNRIVISAIDARRSRFYIRLYNFHTRVDSIQNISKDPQSEIMQATLSPPCDCRPEEIIENLCSNISEELLSYTEGEEILIVGPHSNRVYESLSVVLEDLKTRTRHNTNFCTDIRLKPMPYSPWILNMLELGRYDLLNNRRDSAEQGPEYIRREV